jgi:hypothetical protein
LSKCGRLRHKSDHKTPHPEYVIAKIYNCRKNKFTHQLSKETQRNR